MDMSGGSSLERPNAPVQSGHPDIGGDLEAPVIIGRLLSYSNPMHADDGAPGNKAFDE